MRIKSQIRVELLKRLQTVILRHAPPATYNGHVNTHLRQTGVISLCRVFKEIQALGNSNKTPFSTFIMLKIVQFRRYMKICSLLINNFRLWHHMDYCINGMDESTEWCWYLRSSLQPFHNRQAERDLERNKTISQCVNQCSIRDPNLQIVINVL